MPRFSIPTCYFPSTTLFLDDNRNFLLNFVLQLEEDVAYQIFDAPLDALNYLQHKRCELDVLNRHCLSEYTEAKNCPMTNHTINVDLAAIHAEIYNPHRFSEMTVVVVDYAMPGMDGLEFCRRMENSNIKKILLTGQADEKLAIEAFHEGLIHRYIRKSDMNVTELLIKSIRELQLQYFQSMSHTIVRMLSVTSPSCLQDKNFAKFFYQFLKDNQIVEYYLVDNSGSFLMLDQYAQISFLIVKSQQDLRLHYDQALDTGASNDILDELSNGEKIPGFWQASATNPAWTDWENCLVPAQSFVSDETYYYAYLQGDALFDIRRNKILSYHRYLETLDMTVMEL